MRREIAAARAQRVLRRCLLLLLAGLVWDPVATAGFEPVAPYQGPNQCAGGSRVLFTGPDDQLLKFNDRLTIASVVINKADANGIVEIDPSSDRFLVTHAFEIVRGVFIDNGRLHPNSLRPVIVLSCDALTELVASARELRKKVRRLRPGRRARAQTRRAVEDGLAAMADVVAEAQPGAEISRDLAEYVDQLERHVRKALKTRSRAASRHRKKANRLLRLLIGNTQLEFPAPDQPS